MKPVKNKIFLIQFLLLVFSTSFTMLTLFIGDKTIIFWPSSFGVINENQQIFLGVAPLSLLSMSISFLFIYLLFEFYGFKNAFYALLLNSLSLIGVYYVFFGISKLPFIISNQYYETIKLTPIVLKLTQILSLALSFLGGQFVTLLLAATVKKITRNYFMFLRYSIAGICGFTLWNGLNVYLGHFQKFAIESMISMAITPVAQGIVFILATVVPLYVLRLVLVFFRGRIDDGNEEANSDGNLFRGNGDIPVEDSKKSNEKQEKDEITVKTKKSSKVSEDNDSENGNEDNPEPTVSQKVNLSEAMTS